MSEPERKTPWRRLEETIRLWTPILLSCSAISLTIFQANATRKHQRLSVTPRLDTRWTYDGGTQEVLFTLVNVGLGPALLKSLVLHHQGDILGASDLQTCAEVSRRLGREGNDWEMRCFDPGAEYYIRSGESVLLYGSRPNDPVTAQERAFPPIAPGSVTITVEYCSFYDECWTFQSK